MDAEIRYEYSSSLDSRSLRLLKIQPAESSDETVRCVLENFDLAEAPAYFALSYTWGDAEGEDEINPAVSSDPSEHRTERVWVDGRTLFVTSNLHDAVKQLRMSSVTGYYWIDMICINQSDLVERSVQVNIMDKIFHTAQSVIVWLGKDNGEGQQVSQIIRQLASISKTHGKEMYERRRGANLFDFENPDVLRQFGLPSLNDQITLWQALISFYKRRWFQRVWTLQEVALAREVIVRYGDILIPWSTLSGCSSFLSTSNLSRGLVELDLRTKPYRGASQAFPEIGTSVGMANAMQTLCRGEVAEFGHEYTIFADRLTGSSQLNRNISTLMVLIQYMMGAFRSTDPRDKIYGALGMINQISQAIGITPPDIKADYTKSVVDVFQEAALFVLEESHWLGPLTLVQDKCVRNFPNLPSWVPDFTARGPNPMLAFDRTEEARFDASNCRLLRPRSFFVDHGRLCLEVSNLGWVVDVSEPCLEMANEGHFERCASLILNSSAEYLTGQHRVEVLWRTLITDSELTQHPAPAKLASSFHAWMTYLILKGVNLHAELAGISDGEYLMSTMPSVDLLARSDTTKTIPGFQELLRGCERLKTDLEALSAELTTESQAFQLMAFETLTYRRLFRLDSGHIGLGPQSIQAGDEVCIVSGSQVPLVFRTLKSGGESVSPLGRPRYELLGEAYVHGVMHGEALKDGGPVWDQIVVE